MDNRPYVIRRTLDLVRLYLREQNGRGLWASSQSLATRYATRDDAIRALGTTSINEIVIVSIVRLKPRKAKAPATPAPAPSKSAPLPITLPDPWPTPYPGIQPWPSITPVGPWQPVIPTRTAPNTYPWPQPFETWCNASGTSGSVPGPATTVEPERDMHEQAALFKSKVDGPRTALIAAAANVPGAFVRVDKAGITITAPDGVTVNGGAR